MLGRIVTAFIVAGLIALVIYAIVSGLPSDVIHPFTPPPPHP